MLNKKGFTLMEMVVVVAIIVVLFLLTIPNVRKVMDSVDNKGCDALLKVVEAAILEYKLDNGSYPNDISDLISEGYLSEGQNTCTNGSNVYISNGVAYHD